MMAVKCEGVKVFASQGKKYKSYKHVSSFEINFSRNCILHVRLKVLLKYVLLYKLKRIRSVVGLYIF